VTYDVFFGTTLTPIKVSGNQSGVTYDPGTMDYEVTYYWKISAWDEHGLKTAGPLWNFTTENAWVTIQIINGSIHNVSYGVSIINIYPANESHITKTQPTLLFTLVNSTGSSNYTVYTGNLSTDVTHYLSNDSFVGNGTYHADYFNATGYYVEYYWRVSVNDSSYWTNETYHFSVVHDGGMVPVRSPLAIVGVMALFIALGIFLFIFVMKRRKENE
jgi:hypothetical protein